VVAVLLVIVIIFARWVIKSLGSLYRRAGSALSNV